MEKASGGEALGERRAGDELHDEGVGGAVRLEAVDLGDVRVVELGEELRFALEPRQAFLVGSEIGRQDLDRDFALQPGVGRL